MKNKKIIAALVFAAAVIAVIASLAFIIKGGIGNNNTAGSTSASMSGTVAGDFVFPPLCGVHEFGDDGVCDVCYVISEDIAVFKFCGDGGERSALIGFKSGTVLPETVRIPDEYQGRPVESILRGCFEKQKTLRALLLPDSIRFIYPDAFSLCTSLEYVNSPKELERIGRAAFYTCPSLASFHIPEGVMEIQAGAFSCMKEGFTVTVDPKNTVYHESGNCLIDTKRKMLVYGNSASVIPDDGSVNTIGQYAFKYDKYIKEIDIPTSVDFIYGEAFSACASLEKVTMRGVDTVGGGAFQGCKNLETVIFSDALELIEGNAFAGCSRLREAVLPKSLYRIGAGAFMNCTSLVSVQIDEGVREIDMSAFAGCSSLGSIVLPESLTAIGESVFNGCKSLKKVTVPSRIEEIGKYTFRGCDRLEVINVPEGVQKIYESAFDDCEMLTAINYGGTVKRWKEISYDIIGGCTVYCSDGRINLWE